MYDEFPCTSMNKKIKHNTAFVTRIQRTYIFMGNLTFPISRSTAKFCHRCIRFIFTNINNVALAFRILLER